MALTESDSLPKGLPKGAVAPLFALPDPLGGGTVSRDDHAGSPLLVVFMCNHCPYVVHILDELVRAAADFRRDGVATVAISANDVTAYPADAPEKMADLARAHDFGFPYLYDETQAVARAYRAVCTPEPFLFDADHHLFYHGQFDDTRPRQGASAHGADLRRAVDAMLSGQSLPQAERPSVGCSIKWRRGS